MSQEREDEGRQVAGLSGERRNASIETRNFLKEIAELRVAFARGDRSPATRATLALAFESIAEPLLAERVLGPEIEPCDNRELRMFLMHERQLARQILLSPMSAMPRFLQAAAESVASSSAPFKIDSYRLGMEVGREPPWVVYSGVDASNGQRVWVYVRDKKSFDSAWLRVFFETAYRGATFRHPSALMVKSVGQGEHGEAYFVVDAPQGESLESMMARGISLNENQLFRVGESLLMVLKSAHSQGFLHQRLQAGCVYFGDPVQLMGVGLAALFDEGVDRRGWYRPPEQAGGARGDLYALAVLMYELMSGNLICKSTDWIPQHPARYWQVLSRALEADQGKRFESAGVFLTAWRAAAAIASSGEYRAMRLQDALPGALGPRPPFLRDHTLGLRPVYRNVQTTPSESVESSIGLWREGYLTNVTERGEITKDATPAPKKDTTPETSDEKKHFSVPPPWAPPVWGPGGSQEMPAAYSGEIPAPPLVATSTVPPPLPASSSREQSAIDGADGQSGLLPLPRPTGDLPVAEIQLLTKMAHLRAPELKPEAKPAVHVEPSKKHKLIILEHGEEKTPEYQKVIQLEHERLGDALEMSERDLAFLQSLDFLKSLTTPEMRALGICFDRRVISQPVLLFDTGELQTAAYVIGAGTVAVGALDGQKQFVVLQHLEAGTILSERALIEPGRHALRAEILKGARLYRIDRASFGRLLRDKTAVASKLLQCIGRVMCDRLRTLNQQFWPLPASSSVEKNQKAKIRHLFGREL